MRCPRCQVLNEPDDEFCIRCGAPLTEPGYRGRRRRWRITLEGTVLGLMMLVVLATLVFVLFTFVVHALHPAERVDPFQGRSGTTASTSTTTAAGSGGQGPSTSTSLSAVQIRPRSADSSSALRATNVANYRATNLFDGDLATAWCEGVDGVGLGEWVEFEFAEPARLVRLEIANGNQEDDFRFNGSLRVKTIKIDYSDGSIQLVDLLDTKEFQSIEPLPQETEWVRITVTAVHPGYIWADAALSEVRVFELVDQQ